MKFVKIGFETPLNKDILLYWEKNCGHIRNGILFLRDNMDLGCIVTDIDGCIHIITEDGPDAMPTHYTLAPEVEE
jgi:hypothetical protein